MLVDSTKCARDCDACVRACDDEHGLEPVHGPATDPRWIHKVTLRDRTSGRISTLALMCQHCADPPCVDVCPTGASFRRADGIVLVDKHTCIGCRYCVMACPFQARAFVHEAVGNPRPWSPRGKGTVESCNLCVHRVDAAQGRDPACVEACAGAGHRALVFATSTIRAARYRRRWRPVRARSSVPTSASTPESAIGGSERSVELVENPAGYRGQSPPSTGSTNAPLASRLHASSARGIGPHGKPVDSSGMTVLRGQSRADFCFAAGGV